MMTIADVKVADWSSKVQPFWGQVIRSAFSVQAVKAVIKAGWATFKVSGTRHCSLLTSLKSCRPETIPYISSRPRPPGGTGHAFDVAGSEPGYDSICLDNRDHPRYQRRVMCFLYHTCCPTVRVWRLQFTWIMPGKHGDCRRLPLPSLNP